MADQYPVPNRYLSAQPAPPQEYVPAQEYMTQEYMPAQGYMAPQGQSPRGYMAPQGYMPQPAYVSPQPQMQTQVYAQPQTHIPPAGMYMDKEPAMLKDGDAIVWEGTTWDKGPTICSCFSPLICAATNWRITSRSIDLQTGCCGRTEDTQDIRGITDIRYKGDVCCGLGRGEIFIMSHDPTHPELILKHHGARKIYHDLKDVWGASKAGMQHIVY